MIHDILKSKNGKTYDVGKVLWVAGVIVFLALSIISVAKGEPWQPTQYGIGLGAVLAGGGAAMNLKKDTEPNSD